MSLWLVRAGKYGEYGSRFLDPDIKAELPPKRIWTIAKPED